MITCKSAMRRVKRLKSLPLANYFYDLRQNFMAKPWLLLKPQAKA